MLGEFSREEILLLAKMMEVGYLVMEKHGNAKEDERLENLERRVWDAIRVNKAIGADWFVESKDLTEAEKEKMSEIVGLPIEIIDVINDKREPYYLADEKLEYLIEEYINPSHEDYFWSELVYDLAMRDMEEDGVELSENMEERFETIARYEGRYNDEFDEHGTDRLRIVE